MLPCNLSSVGAFVQLCTNYGLDCSADRIRSILRQFLMVTAEPFPD